MFLESQQAKELFLKCGYSMQKDVAQGLVDERHEYQAAQTSLGSVSVKLAKAEVSLRLKRTRQR